jgi:hypothetical protein
MAGTQPEVEFDMADLFKQMNRSFTDAALALRKEFAENKDWQNSPFVYTMPRMSLSMRMVLSHTGGTVEVVFHKEKTEDVQELTSTVQIDVVAVPRLSSLSNPP